MGLGGVTGWVVVAIAIRCVMFSLPKAFRRHYPNYHCITPRQGQRKSSRPMAAFHFWGWVGAVGMVKPTRGVAVNGLELGGRGMSRARSKELE